MKFLHLSLLFLLTMAAYAVDTPKKYWIYFSSKEEYSSLKKLSNAELASLSGVTERALQRRMKVSQSTILPEDLPVSSNYLRRLEGLGVTIQNASRWFNAATAYLTDVQRDQINRLPFVRSVEPVVTYMRKDFPKSESSVPSLSKQTADKYSYGSSTTQMNLINAIAVHNIGISGRGVLIGMLDTGFRWKTHEAMQNMQVIAEYDFIQKDSVTANEIGDSGSQDSHGTSTMSLVGGYKDGKLVSPAFRAQFILGKTEYVPSETNVEEDNWVAAIEWMEAQGVDVVSSSLGYSTFDAGQKSYVYADMNGKTATTTKAAVIAARKGVVVTNAMGNEGNPGNAWHFLTSPADADSILSVGAVQSNGTVASFSSYGPTSDGRTKPDVSAQGVSVYSTLPGGTYTGSFGGTSAATPFVAGVSAMLLSARPELTPIQVRDALRSTANNSKAPNNTIGWGIINAYEALLYHGMVIGTDPEITVTPSSDYEVGIFVVSKNSVIKDSVKLFYTTNSGSSFTPLLMTLKEIVDSATNSGKYVAVVPKSETVPKFYVRAADASKQSRTSPYRAPSELYDMKSGMTGVPKQKSNPETFALHQNFPNPFNPSTAITYDIAKSGPVSLTVYDLLGREIQTLVNSVHSPGHFTVIFHSAGLSSGIYLYRLQSSGMAETKRMMLVK